MLVLLWKLQSLHVDRVFSHLSDMVGEYVWVEKDVVVVGDAGSLLPSIGRARRTWSDLQQVICQLVGYFTRNQWVFR